MNPWRPIAMLATLAWALAAPSSQAQTVYRCGNTYSETPCAGGKAVKVDDPRTKAEKAKADADTEAATKTAAELERERRAAEDGELPVKRRGPVKPAAGNKAPAADSKPSGAKTGAAKPALNYFTAIVPPSPKDKGRKQADAGVSTGSSTATH